MYGRARAARPTMLVANWPAEVPIDRRSAAPPLVMRDGCAFPTHAPRTQRPPPRSTANRPAPVQVAEGRSHAIAPGRCARRDGLRIDKPGHSLIGQVGPMVVRAERSKVAPDQEPQT